MTDKPHSYDPPGSADLSGSEQLFRDLTERSLVGVYLIQDGLFKYVNPRFLEIFGYEPGELTHQSYETVVLQDDIPFLRECVRKRIAGEEAYGHYTFRGVKKNKEVIQAEVFSSATLYQESTAVIGTLLDVTERMKAEEEVRENRWRLEFATMLANEAIWDWDLVNDTLTRNEVYARMFGQPPEGSRPADWWRSRIHPEDRERVLAAFARIFKGELDELSVEYRFLLADGSWGVVHDRARPIRNKQGEPIRLIGTMQNVTERKKAEDRIRESESNLRVVMDSVYDAVFIHALDGTIVDVNRKMLELYRVDREQALRSRILEDLSAPGNPVEKVPGIWKRAVSGEDQLFEWKARRPKDDSVFDVEVFLHKITFQSRDLILANVRDITTRKQAEDALRRSETNYREIFDSVNDAIFVHEIDTGDVLSVNRKTEEMFGYGVEEARHFLSESLFTGLPGYTAQDALQKIRLAAQGPSQVFEWRSKRKSGELFWVEVNLKRAVIGGVTRLLAIVREITDRKRIEEEVTRAKDQLEEAQQIAGIGSWERDLRTGKVMLSRELYRILDLRPGEHVRTFDTCITLIHPEDRLLFKQWVEQATKPDVDAGIEFRTVRRDGSVRTIHAKRRIDRDSSGAAVRIRGTAQDVTESRRAEEALELTQFSVDHASVAVFMVARDARILYANEQASRALGYTREQLLTLSVPDLDPDFPASVWDAHWTKLKEERSLHFETKQRKKDGELLPIDLTLNYVAFGGREYNIAFAVDISVRKRTEQKLRESEERFRQLAENTDQVFWFMTVDPESILYVSPAYERIWGYSARELYQRPRLWVEAAHPLDQPMVEAAFDDWVRGKIPVYDIEYRIVRPDETERWVRDRGTLLRDKEGRVTRLSGIADDITDRKRIAGEVTRTKKLLEEAQHIAGVGNWEWDARDDRITWSNEVYRIFGKTPETFTGTFEGFMNMVHPADRPAIEQWLRETAHARREDASIEYRIIRPDGSERIIHTRLRLEYDDAGAIARVRGTAQDLTETRKAEEALKLTQFSLDHAAISVFFVAPDGRFLYVNEQACRKLGYANAELLSMGVYDIDPGRTRSGWAFRWEQIRREAPLHFDTTHRKKDGTLVPTEMSVNYLSFAGREYNVAFGQDISERKKAENSLRQAYVITKTILDSMNDAISLLDVRDFTIIDANRVFLDSYGFSQKSEAVGKHCYQVTHRLDHVCSFPDDVCPLIETVRTKGHYAADHVHYDRKGGKIYVEVSTSPITDDAGNVVQVVHVQRNITERKRAEEALRESEERFRAFFESAAVGAAELEPETRCFLRVNDRFCEITGYSREELSQKTVYDLTHPEDRKEDERRFELAKQGEIREHSIEKRYIRKDGHVVWVDVSGSIIRDRDGKPIRAAAIVQDVTERKHMQDEIRHLAHHDALTGLPNRRLFNEIAGVELAQAQRNLKKLALLFLDLDRFKEINDTLGHETGDRLLKEVASRLKSVLRRSDSIGRIGGDEFNIILADIARPDVVPDIARKLVETVRRPYRIGGHELRVTASIGISIYPDDGADLDTLLRYADMAMYHAKEVGRNVYQFFNPAINIRSIERMRLENMLRRSLELGEMEIYYQPLIDVASGKILCAEALLRWQHPERGLLAPRDFLGTAEETGFIAEVDEWVLREVCTQIKKWLDAGLPHYCVTVNLSARQFQSSDILQKMTHILTETGAPADSLDIEVTERTAMRDVEQSAGLMRQLAGMGIHISIDDFGTGYSSLNYLKRMPIEKLKIDRSFISDITSDHDDRAIIEAVTAMAHSMGIKVIAEGVESEDQLSFLRKIGCDEAQGFLFSRPVTADMFRELVETGK